MPQTAQNVLACSAAMLPLWHGVHSEAPNSAKVPWSHGMQESPGPDGTVPGSQPEQLAAPGPETDPGEQGDLTPLEHWNVDSHSRQTVLSLLE